MPITRVTSDTVSEPPPETWSNCLLVDGVAYVAGLTSRSDEFNRVEGDDEYSQTVIIFNKFKAYIEAAGGRMSDVTKVTIFVTNIANREQVWKGRREFFEGNFPASSLIEISALAMPEMLVEIEGIAHIGASSR